MPKKLNIKDIETKFKEEGYTLLTKEYLNNKQLLTNIIIYFLSKTFKDFLIFLSWFLVILNMFEPTQLLKC